MFGSIMVVVAEVLGCAILLYVLAGFIVSFQRLLPILAIGAAIGNYFIIRYVGQKISLSDKVDPLLFLPIAMSLFTHLCYQGRGYMDPRIHENLFQLVSVSRKWESLFAEDDTYELHFSRVETGGFIENTVFLGILYFCFYYFLVFGTANGIGWALTPAIYISVMSVFDLLASLGIMLPELITRFLSIIVGLIAITAGLIGTLTKSTNLYPYLVNENNYNKCLELVDINLSESYNATYVLSRQDNETEYRFTYDSDLDAGGYDVVISDVAGIQRQDLLVKEPNFNDKRVWLSSIPEASGSGASTFQFVDFVEETGGILRYSYPIADAKTWTDQLLELGNLTSEYFFNSNVYVDKQDDYYKVTFNYYSGNVMSDVVYGVSYIFLYDENYTPVEFVSIRVFDERIGREISYQPVKGDTALDQLINPDNTVEGYVYDEEQVVNYLVSRKGLGELLINEYYAPFLTQSQLCYAVENNKDEVIPFSQTFIEEHDFYFYDTSYHYDHYIHDAQSKTTLNVDKWSETDALNEYESRKNEDSSYDKIPLYTLRVVGNSVFETEKDGKYCMAKYINPTLGYDYDFSFGLTDYRFTGTAYDNIIDKMFSDIYWVRDLVVDRESHTIYFTANSDYTSGLNFEINYEVVNNGGLNKYIFKKYACETDYGYVLTVYEDETYDLSSNENKDLENVRIKSKFINDENFEKCSSLVNLDFSGNYMAYYVDDYNYPEEQPSDYFVYDGDLDVGGHYKIVDGEKQLYKLAIKEPNFNGTRVWLERSAADPNVFECTGKATEYVFSREVNFFKYSKTPNNRYCRLEYYPFDETLFSPYNDIEITELENGNYLVSIEEDGRLYNYAYAFELDKNYNVVRFDSFCFIEGYRYYYKPLENTEVFEGIVNPDLTVNGYTFSAGDVIA